MKIRNLLTILCLCTSYVNAQMYFEVNTGVNKSNLISKKAEGVNIKSRIGYIITSNINIPLTNTLTMQTGLEYEFAQHEINSVKYTYIDIALVFKKNSKEIAYNSYINVPVKLLYKIPSGKGSFNFGAGPYLNIGISGKRKIDQTTFYIDLDDNTVGFWGAYHYNKNVKYGSADTTIRRASIGVGANLSYILSKNFKFSLYSNIVLTDQDNVSGETTKPITYGIGIGYIFGRINQK